MLTRFLCSPWAWLVPLLLGGAFLYWSTYHMRPDVNHSVIESFAAQQVVERLGRYDYARLDPPILMTTGHDNDHLVSGSGTFIRFGRSGDSKMPTTQFLRIRYVVVVSIKCAKWAYKECLAVRKITILNNATKQPLI